MARGHEAVAARSFFSLCSLHLRFGKGEAVYEGGEKVGGGKGVGGEGVRQCRFRQRQIETAWSDLQ